MKTIRKLPLLGYTDNNKLAINFVWPEEQDMLQMPEDKPIEAVGFNWHKSDANNANYIGALQVILSNGQTSPVFLCLKQVQKNLQRVNLTAPVKTIRGTYSGTHVSYIFFHDVNNKQVAEINTGYKSNFAPDCVLNEGEVIIGVYGTN